MKPQKKIVNSSINLEETVKNRKFAPFSAFFPKKCKFSLFWQSPASLSLNKKLFWGFTSFYMYLGVLFPFRNFFYQKPFQGCTVKNFRKFRFFWGLLKLLSFGIWKLFCCLIVVLEVLCSTLFKFFKNNDWVKSYDNFGQARWENTGDKFYRGDCTRIHITGSDRAKRKRQNDQEE